jgi:6-phospho-3-hexuloisomerase
MNKEFSEICSELSNVSNNLTDKKVAEIIKLIFKSKRIFLSGEGRSGLMIKAFANRLSQIGLQVHVVSEITAPAIGFNDLLIFNSASGSSTFLNSQAKNAREAGSKIISFTSDKTAPLSQNSDMVILIDAPTKDKINGSIQPMGSLYEQASLILFDSLILKAIKQDFITTAKLRSLHSNLE